MAEPEWKYQRNGEPEGFPIEGASVFMGDKEAVILLPYAETDQDFAAERWKSIQLRVDGVKAGQLGLMLMQVGAGLLEGDPVVQASQSGQDR